MNNDSLNLNCPHYSKCSGCSLDQDLTHPQILYEAKDFFSLNGVETFNLETAVQGNRVMQDFELESPTVRVDHFQKVKATRNGSDYGSKDYVNLLPSTAVSRFNFHAGAIHGWRCRAKLAVRGTVEKPLIGLFEKASHLAIDIPFCKVHHPLINQTVSKLRSWMIENQIVPYEETTGSGFLRYIQLTVDRSLQKVQVALVLIRALLIALMKKKNNP